MAFEMLMEGNDASSLTEENLGSIIGVQKKGGMNK